MSLTIQRPTLLLDRKRAIKNIKRMAAKAQRSKVRFRPHFKTHQSAQIGEWFRLFGVDSITVSSVTMAQYFARHGWQDITVAFPVNILEIEQINQLAGQAKLSLLVESVETVGFVAQNLMATVDVWVKVDVGYGRTGILAADIDQFVTLVQQIEKSSQLSLKGLLTHAGHTYHTQSTLDIETIYRDMVLKLQTVREELAVAGFGPLELSIGDTPSCSVVDDLSDVDEIRPGNFVFYDVMQLQLGACREEDIAVAVACPVVAKHPERNQVVIYGGAVHHAKEFIVENGVSMFGYVARFTESGWSPRVQDAYISSLSQEHGIVTADADFVNQIEIGDVLVILPVHSCLTVNLLREYHTVEDDVYRCL